MKIQISGGDDPKKKAVKIKTAPYDFDTEMQGAYMKPLRYDNNRPAKDVVLSAAQKSGIDPSFLMASAYQEGLGKAILKPDERSVAYDNAANGTLEFDKIKPKTAQARLNTKDFPVDGFFNYGLDTFGTNYNKLKKYLPEGFESKFQLYDAYNDAKIKDPKTGKLVDNPQQVKTAAFRTNEDALIAKSAFMKMGMDELSDFARQKGIPLDDKAKKYFTLAYFNGGPEHAKTMMQEYAKAKDKNAFIDNGETSLKGVHKNIAPRLKRMALAAQLLGMKEVGGEPAPTNQ